MVLTSDYMIGQYVKIDQGDVGGFVSSILFRKLGDKPTPQYEVVWIANGVPQSHYFEGWRLST